VHLLHNNLKDLQLQADVESRSMNRRLDTAISDRCYELLYKVQDLSSKLKTEKRNLVSLESTVRENLKKEFQEQISELNTQLTVVKGQFAECVAMLAPLVVNFICVIMRVCACNVLHLFYLFAGTASR
jgi:predicted  nucleic acid-binding Zn-ribbon protein